MRISTIVAVLAVTAGISGCGQSPLERALTGAGMGAGAGALGGLAFDANPGTAALIGAGVGAAAGLLTAPSTSGHCTGGILDGCW